MRWWLMLAVMLLSVPAWAVDVANVVDVVDDRGVRVAFQKPPARIVSLLPSLTETVCALGACERVVAVDTYASWPPQITQLPRVGGLDDTQVERIVALRPDVVLAATSTRVIARLESLGLKVVAIEPRSLADLKRTIDRLDRLLATGQGEALWRRLEADLAQAARELPPSARGLRVYFEVDDGPYAASESSFVGELLARLGAVNVVPASLGPFPRLNPEYVVRADPQVIMRSGQGEPVETRPGWRAIRAIREHRVCRFDAAEADVIVRAGPRLAEGARLIVQCL